MQNVEQSKPQPTATIMMGLPGSGKTNWVEAFCKQDQGLHIVCSADDYFLDRDRNYKYIPAKAQQAHAACLFNFIAACQSGVNVICDNCNVTPHALAPYVAVARAFGHKVRIVYCCPENLRVAFERNVHGITQEQFNFERARLMELLQKWPGIWPELETVKT